MGKIGKHDMVLGIDEAGRGPLVGPLVIAGVAVAGGDIDLLREIGVDDSKKLTRSRREELFNTIVDIARVVIVRKVAPKEIDSENLNELSYRAVLSIIEALCTSSFSCPRAVYIDNIGVADSFRRRIEHAARVLGVDHVVMEPKADSKYTVVGAASIVAKVLRDWEILNLSRHIGDFGSGYVSDPKTVDWLNRLGAEDMENVGYFIRRKWSTYRRRQPQIINLDKYTLNGERDIE